MGLYRPTVTKRKKNGESFRLKSGKWWGSFRDPSTNTLRRIPLGTRDKSAAQILLRDAERKAAMAHAGLVSPYEKHHERPLTKHLEEYETHLRNSNASSHHIETVVPRVRKLLVACNFKFWSDLSASRVEQAVAGLRMEGRSMQTCNFYLQAIKQFCRWMVRDGRAPTSPIAHLKGGNVRIDRRHDRRALVEDELRRLLAVTVTATDSNGMSGRERSIIVSVRRSARRNRVREG